MQGINGRTQKIGGMYFEKLSNGEFVRKYCVGYSDGKKIGLTSWEVNEFLSNSHYSFPDLFKRIFHAKILIP